MSVATADLPPVLPVASETVAETDPDQVPPTEAKEKEEEDVVIPSSQPASEPEDDAAPSDSEADNEEKEQAEPSEAPVRTTRAAAKRSAESVADKDDAEQNKQAKLSDTYEQLKQIRCRGTAMLADFDAIVNKFQRQLERHEMNSPMPAISRRPSVVATEAE